MEFGHTQWRKSSFSDHTETCVEIAYSAESPTVGVRDSKNRGGGVLWASLPAWEAFRLSNKRAALDLP